MNSKLKVVTWFVVGTTATAIAVLDGNILLAIVNAGLASWRMNAAINEAVDVSVDLSAGSKR